jgi:hypothetical protein
MAKKTPQKKTVKSPKPPKTPKSEEIGSKLKPAQMRFVYLLLGAEDGKCFNNGTLAYLRAYDIDTRTTRDADGKYSSEYLSAKANASRMITNANIQKFKNQILLESGFNPDTIKKRFAELAYQNKNLVIAHASTRDIAKIAGVIKEDSKTVDIPQLEAIGESIRNILTPKK